jgi:hypothetical protein
MSNFSALIATIQANIKTNGNEEITGAVLQDVLEAMVQALGTEAINNLETALSNEVGNRQNADGTLQNNIDAEVLRAGTAEGVLQTAINGIKSNIDNGYVYAGIATPSGTPASGKVFYLAVTAGTYTNYGALVVTQGINILKNNGTAWSQEQLIALDNTPTPSSSGLVKSGGVFEEIMTNGSAFDLTVHNSGTTYADLSAALIAMDSLPAAYKKGGMSIKFVQTSDNKYVQYRLMANSFSTTVTDWQGVDDEPTAGSDNLVESGGVEKGFAPELYVGRAYSIKADDGAYTNYDLNLVAGFSYQIDVESTITPFTVSIRKGNTNIITLSGESSSETFIYDATTDSNIIRFAGVGTIVKVIATKTLQENVSELNKTAESINGTLKTTVNTSTGGYADYDCILNAGVSYKLIIESGINLSISLKNVDGENNSRVVDTINVSAGKSIVDYVPEFEINKIRLAGDGTSVKVYENAVSSEFLECISSSYGTLAGSLVFAGGGYVDNNSIRLAYGHAYKLVINNPFTNSVDLYIRSNGVNVKTLHCPVGTSVFYYYADINSDVIRFAGTAQTAAIVDVYENDAIGIAYRQCCLDIFGEAKSIILTDDAGYKDYTLNISGGKKYRLVVKSAATNVASIKVVTQKPATNKIIRQFELSAGINTVYYKALLDSNVIRISGTGNEVYLYEISEDSPFDSIIVVDQKGHGDFTDLGKALAYIGDSPSNHVTILVMPGIYDMPNMLNKVPAYEPNYRNLSIIGIDKKQCIIINNDGYYDASSYDCAVLRLGGNCHISNLSIMQTATNFENFCQEYSLVPTDHKRAYCIHLDADANAGDNIVIDNCDLYSYAGACFGIGTRPNYKITIKNCYMYLDAPEELQQQDFYGVLIAHSYGGSVSDYSNQKLEIIDCILETYNARCACWIQQHGGTQGTANNFITYRLIRNALKSANQQEAFVNVGQYNVKEAISYGNNVDSANYTI